MDIFCEKMAIDNEYCLIHLQEQNAIGIEKLKEKFANTFEKESDNSTNKNHISMADIDYNINAQNGSTKTTQTANQSKFVCKICGIENIGGRVAKGVQKTVGNTIMGGFGTLAFLTGGLTAPVMFGAAMVGAGISGSAEIYSLCSECRNK
jgi:hypothetical protein